MLINVVSENPASIWERERPENFPFEVIYTEQPVDADYQVYYDKHKRVDLNYPQSRQFFFATEPPEIKRYGLGKLARFRIVAGPRFKYLRSLPNFREARGILPWRIGINYETTETPKATTSKQEIKDLAIPTDPILTTVTSGKTLTQTQVARIELVKYLEKRLKNFEVYGRDSRKIVDKLFVHKLGRFHLAIENSFHSQYFTEKLTDPLLVGNHVFYAGHKDNLFNFNRNTITRIPLTCKRTALYKIQKTMEQKQEIEYEATLRNRNLILEKYNFHCQLQKILSEVL